MSLIGRSYLVPFRIDSEGLLNQLEPIEQELTKVQTLFDSFQQNLIYQKGRKSLQPDDHITTLVPDTLRQHLKFLIADVHKHKTNIINFLKTLHLSTNTNTDNSKMKRGAINAAGDLLGWAFGLATEESLDKQQQRIESLEDLTNSLLVETQVHQEILNASLIHMELLDSQQNRIAQCLNNVASNLRVFVNASDMRYSDIAQLIALSNGLSYITTGMLNLLSTYQDFKSGIQLFNQGRLSPDLIPVNTLLEIVDDISKRNLKVIFPATEKYIEFYFQYVKVIPLTQPGDFILKFPLLSQPDIQFDLFQVTSLPFPIGRGKVISFHDLSNYLGVSSDWTFYIDFDTLDECDKYQDLYLCQVSRPINKGTSSNCLAQIYHKQEQLDACNRHISVASEKIFFSKLPHGWFYTAIEPITIAVSCPHTEINQLNLEQGAGRLNISNACKVSAKHFILPSTTEISGIPKNFSIPIIKFNLTLNNMEKKAIKLIHSEPLITDIIESVGGSIPLAAMRTELANIPNIQRLRKLNSYTSISSLAVGILALVLILFSISFTIYAYNVCRNYGNQVDRRQAIPLQNMA